ncbi:J domain-containing protein [Christiangramia forsetii]|uniref:Protein containing heat shock protein DnaJ N-terminal domain n=2 Tax=Christiangramia forsetii TaxID=411153 RepID=A0M4L5_CHRFK|nr:DnaJ domain-containing protein [Christiangramia forsetii]GGG23153.1 hypothetical protein GCM10011532_02830 [Christiangramia forsetii]CAL67560.1 protein containing heat shock protein DnaJ N-terminal domain [Christiangramia forsetii KT0803]
MADYYKILGVSKRASKKEIERAFYKIKSKFSSEDVEDPYYKNFYRRILEAYNVLSNDKLKAQYDQKFDFSKEKTSNEKKKEDKTPSEPIINYFKSNRESLSEGKKLILTWDTSFADKITLNPGGKVNSTGSKVIFYDDLVEGRTQISLRVLNSSSGKETAKTMEIAKEVNNTQEVYSQTSNPEPAREEKSSVQVDEHISPQTEPSKSDLKKYGVPGGIGILILAIVLFVLGKSGFWETSSKENLNQYFKETGSEKLAEQSDVIKEEETELFPEITKNLNGDKIKYYDPNIVLDELINEIKNNAISESTGFEADYRQFFNSTNNPFEWRKNYNDIGGKKVSTGQIDIGIKQRPYSTQKDPIIERISLTKTGDANSNLLKQISFEIGDSGPPFWEPESKWEAFDELLKNDAEELILVDELNQKNKIFTLHKIPSGYSSGYLNMGDVIIPVSINKIISEDDPTSIEVNFYSSMNGFITNKENITRREKELNILNLMELEGYRDFKLVSQFYSDQVVKYWDNTNLDYLDLESLYQTAWANTDYSMNDVQDIKMYDESNFELITNFEYLNKDGDTISQLSSTHFTFDKDGLIEEEYGVDSDYTYQSVRDSDFDYISDEEKISRLLKAEDDRNFNKVASYYSSDMKRYWHLNEPTFRLISKTYLDSWSMTSYSRNTILDIEKSGFMTYDVRVSFTFYNKEDNQQEAKESATRYIFNDKGLIKEVYGINNNQG